MSLRDQIDFARHVSPKKIAARLKLKAKRRIVSAPATRPLARALRGSPPQIRLGDDLPKGLFRPGGALIAAGADGLTLKFLNHEERFSFPIDWHRRSLDKGTQLWLLNLHYMEWLSDLDDEQFARVTTDWIEGTQCFEKRYWVYSWNSYSLSIRVVSWIREIAHRRERLAPELLERLTRSLAEQIRHLEYNLEKDIGGNHIIKNIKALLWGGAAFEGAAARRWTRKGLQLLRRELAEQILRDGMHYERSASYHALVFADLLECRSVMQQSAERDQLDLVLKKMAAVAVDLAHPDGTPVLFNDAGLHMGPEIASCLRAFELLGFTAPTPSEQIVLPDAGYYGLRRGPTYCVFDGGVIGPDDLPAHAHADVGSFELSVGGDRIIVDPGVFTYDPVPKRQACRIAANHNTLVLGHMDQAALFGSFRCGRRPKVETKHEVTATGLRVEVEHDGFARLRGAPVHRRRVEMSPERIAITDEVTGEHGQTVALAFLLHPDADVEVKQNRARIRRGESEITLESEFPLHLEEAVWWPDMGVEVATLRLRLTAPEHVKEVRTSIAIRVRNPK